VVLRARNAILVEHYLLSIVLQWPLIIYRTVSNGRCSLMTRSSATAERQRVSYTRLSRLTHRSCTSLSTASVLQYIID